MRMFVMLGVCGILLGGCASGVGLGSSQSTSTVAPTPGTNDNASAAAPAAPANTQTANVAPSQPIAGLSEKRLAIKVVDSCPQDDEDQNCDRATLDGLRDKVAAAVSNKHIFSSIGDSNPDVVLNVMLTSYKLDTPGGGLLGTIGDLASTADGSANFQLVDTAGHILRSGTATGQDPDSDEAVWQQMADKMAAAIAVSANP